MWSFRINVVIGALLVAGLMAGCGFRPLHGGSSPGVADGTSQELALIAVAPIKDRLGQELHNQLLDLLSPRGRPRKPIYTLHVDLSQSIQLLAVRKSEFATRANLSAAASFSMTDARGGKTIFEGQSLAVTSFDVLSSEFGTLTAEKDAGRRAVTDLAQDMRNRIAVFFSKVRARGRE